MRRNTKFHTKKGLLFTASLSEQHTKRTNLVVATVGETAGDVGSMTIYNTTEELGTKREDWKGSNRGNEALKMKMQVVLSFLVMSHFRSNMS